MDDDLVTTLSRDILDRFVAGDRVAMDMVVRFVLPRLHRWAHHAYPGLPDDAITNAVHDVVIDLCRHPERYDPDRSQVTTYLTNLLRHRLKDVYAKHQTIAVAEKPLDDHEKLMAQPYNMIEAVEATTYVARESLFKAVIAQLDPLERDVLDLMRQGVKDLAEYATIHARYGVIDNIPREVENTKMRIRGRIKRTAERLGYQADDLLDV